MLILSSLERTELLLALDLAISHESKILSLLENDRIYYPALGTAQGRRDQIARFERLRDKLKKSG
jgi:hypothetical protein